MKLIDRKTAIRRNLEVYYTGKKCVNGHLAKRFVNGRVCCMCKKMYNIKASKYKKENYSKSKRKEYYINNIEKEMFYGAKRRAKKKNIPFTITPKDVIIPTHCPILGIPLDRRNRLHSPSLDRIINEKGYVSDNIQVVSMKANALKSNGTIQDFYKIIRYMRKHEQKGKTL